MKRLRLNPRLVGQVFRQGNVIWEEGPASLNPRLVGQVFRLQYIFLYVKV